MFGWFLVNGKHPRKTCMRIQNTTSSTLSSPILFLHPLCRAGKGEFADWSILVPIEKGYWGREWDWSKHARRIAPPLPSYLTHGLVGPVFFVHRRGKHGGRELCVQLLSIVSVPLFEVWKGFERSPTMGNDE